MFSLVYMSTASPGFDESNVVDILRVARKRNGEIGVTGMLLFKDGSFMQALEGDEDVVRGLFSLIQTDPRHYGITIMLERQIEKREFPEWTMAFCNPDLLQPNDVKIFNDYLIDAEDKALGAGAPSLAKAFLKKFKHAIR